MQQALTEAFALAITAPTAANFKEAAQLAEQIAASLPKHEVERAKLDAIPLAMKFDRTFK